MRTWGGYKQQRKPVREYGDSLCCTGTVTAANALHLSPLPSAALGARGRGKCCLRLPSTDILHNLTPAGITACFYPVVRLKVSTALP